MSITLYKGSRGRGKTLSMVKDAYNFYCRGYRVVSNFNMKFGEHISNEEILELNKESELFDCVLVLDEVQIFFDSRNFKQKRHMDFSNFIQQIRKRNINILCTAQYSNTIELRLRQHIDYVAYPRYIKELEVCEVLYFDLTLLEDDLDPRNLEPVRIIYNCKEVFPLYDTKEMLI